jgi:hypothetical protein
MGKAKSWVGGPYGEYCGQCCDNCHHYWDDMETAGCDLGRPLWDEQYLVNYLARFDTYIDYLKHTCPDWVSAYLTRKQQQPTLI